MRLAKVMLKKLKASTDHLAEIDVLLGLNQVGTGRAGLGLASCADRIEAIKTLKGAMN